MYLFTITAAVTALILAVAAVLLFFTQRRAPLVQIFIYYLLITTCWIGSNSIADITTSSKSLFFWSAVAISTGALQMSVYLLFLHFFVHKQYPSKIRFLLYSLPSLLTIPFAFSEYSIAETILYTDQPNSIIPGPLYLVALLATCATLAAGIIMILRYVAHTPQQERTQAIYVAIGFTSVVIGILLFDVILPLVGEVRFYNVGPQFALIFAFCTGYAILKHQLLDIKIVIQRGFVYTIILGIITGLYATLISSATNLYQQQHQTLLNVTLGVIAIIISVLVVPRLDRFLRRITDPIFFSDRYEYQETLRDLSSSLRDSIELESIITLSETKLAEALRAEYIHISNRVPKRPYVLTIPIPSNPQVSLYVGAKRSGTAYTSDDEFLLQTFANQAAVALSRALLYQEVKKRASELETRVEERTRELRVTQEAQKSLMLQLTHNLQTPLAILLTSFEKIRGEISDSQFLSLEHAVKDVSQFITRLLHLARLESGQETAVRQDFSLSELLTDITEEVTVIAEDKHKTITTNIMSAIQYNGDPLRLREAILNVLSNALKYGDASPIELTLKNTKTTITITCRNHGSFISKADLAHIFTPFYRSTAHANITGTGLGLAITRQIIEQHGGTIKVTSTKQHGTSFTITLPN